MNLTHFKNMDVNILLSIINMQLRDKFQSLDDLVRYHDIDSTILCDKLALANFHYDSTTNQFK